MRSPAVQRVVLDANVWISAIVFPGGPPDTLVRLAHSGSIRALTSESIVDQVQGTLPKFGWNSAQVASAALTIRAIGEMVPESTPLDIITEKLSDNRILECAVAGNADVIVTGDKKHLLPLVEYQGIPLLSPRAFFEQLESSTRQFKSE